MCKSVILFWAMGSAAVLFLMLCVSIKKYFNEGITLSEIVQGVFYSIMSWSFFILCLFAAVLGVLEKMQIDNKIIIKGRKYPKDEC